MADVGRVLGGRYALVELIGQGGMATIYRARDTKLGRDVALKILRGEYGSDASFLARFQREAQAAAQLNHPNLVAVFDYGQDPVGPYIVMELVTGGDLAGALRERGPLPATVAASIGQQVADAIDAAHARGIVHRDIKPSNVLLSTGGRVKVADFGIAQAFTDAQLTMTGVTMGSVHYFSPEQARGEPVTAASDVYSTGLVLYEMLTGHRAFSGGTAAEVAMARLGGRIPSPMEARLDVPAALDAIVRWSLQPDPRARPTASELASSLGRFLADPLGTSTWRTGSTPAVIPTGSVGPAPSTSVRYRGATPARRSRGSVGWVAGLLGLFVLVVVAVLLMLSFLAGFGSGQAGDTAAPGSRVPGPTPVAVPGFVGMRIEDARVLADRADVQLDEHQRTSERDEPGTIIEQDPAEGVAMSPGGTVKVVVAQQVDTVRVPNLRGDTESQAKTRLVEAGLTPTGRFQTYDSEVRKGRVVRTEPGAGTEVAQGTTVAYYVSRGPRPTATSPPAVEPISVGDYRCLSLDDARRQMEAARLVVGTVLPPEPQSDGSWLVEEQSPTAGAEVQPGSVVRLWGMDPGDACP
jgi:beta-lactam-binding protein with PASTA domain/tRNA A-37 threonylcarbamoyl transferase component Bud32